MCNEELVKKGKVIRQMKQKLNMLEGKNYEGMRKDELL